MAVRSYDPDTDFGYVFSLRPRTWKYDIGYKSWHTLWSWSTYVENIIYIQNGIKELWSGQDMNMHTVRRTGRQPDSQGDSYISP